MKEFSKYRSSALKGLILALASISVLPAVTFAAAATTNTSNTSNTATQQQHLANIISKGDQEITRRLNTLNTLSGKITSSTKLSSSDQAYLQTEVNNEISGLTALKTHLDSDTTLSSAITDAQSIYTEYRVYALVVPKVALINTADNQQALEAKMTTFAQTLQTRINTAKSNGKDVTTLQNELNDMTTQTNNAQSISNSMESSVLTLQPSDYNTDHSILSGDLAKLQTAHSDMSAAYTDAKNIVSGLKSL